MRKAILISDNLNIENLYDKFLASTGVSIDTRSIETDNLFFAIKGENFDGNKYAQQALDSGAKYAVVDNSNIPVDDRFILVENGLQALQLLASHHRKKYQGKVIGITGSNGKTTTKELIYHVLKQQFKVQCTKGNLNNHLGVPLTVLDIKMDSEIAIVEMGANHVGEIAALCKIAQPTHGVITNIGTAHIGEFGGRENIIRAKSELFDYLLKNEGQVFINTEDEVLKNMAKRFDRPSFYPNKLCTLNYNSPYVSYFDDEGKEHATHLIGSYNFFNISAAVTIGNYFNVKKSDIYKSIANYIPNNNRSQILKIGTNTVILDAYNANPDSTKAALTNLSEFEGKTKIAILGDMKELGKYSLDEHRKTVEFAENLQLETLYFVGEEYAKVSSVSYSNLESVITEIKKNPISNAVVLLKGSRSMAMERLIKIDEIWN